MEVSRSYKHGAAEVWRPGGMEVVEVWRRGLEVWRVCGYKVPENMTAVEERLELLSNATVRDAES